jgi:hypothetical protein
VPAIYCWKDLDEQGFLMEFIWEDFGLIYISKKPGFWKEKSVEDVVTLGPTAQATLVNNR